MSARICTKCGKTLTSSNNYFCGFCGDMLSPSLVQKPEIPNVNIAKYEVLDLNKGLKYWHSFSNSRFFVPVIFILSVLSIVFLFAYLDNQKNIQNVINIKSNVPSNTCSGDYVCGNFGSDSITSIIPENAIFYAEGFDYQKFSQLILDYDIGYTTLISELSHLESKHIALFVENISGVNYWTFIVASTKDPSADLIKLINNSQNVFIGRMTNFYIISSRRNIMGDLQKVKDGLVKNYGQNSKYSIITSNNKNGQLLIMATKESKELFVKKVLSNEKVSGYIKNILNKIDFEKESYLVI